MGATTTSVPRAHIHSEVFQESLIYSGRTNDIHPWTRILQWAHQRYTSLDSHPTLGALVIYIPRLAFYSGCSDNKHPLGSHGSSLPRHSAKERTRYTEKNQKRNKRQKPRVDYKLAQKKNIYIYIYIYDNSI